MTQEQFGEAIGLKKSTYNNYETGTREPKSDFWIAVAEKYGVTIDYLMGRSNNPYFSSLIEENAPSTLDEARLNMLIGALQQLNDEGQEKLVDYADDLVSSGKYIKSDPTGMGKEA